MGSSDWYTWVIDSRDLISRDIGHVTFRHVLGSFLYLLCSSFFGLRGGLIKACLTKLILSDCWTVNWSG